jgi:hypothetical protein
MSADQVLLDFVSEFDINTEDLNFLADQSALNAQVLQRFWQSQGTPDFLIEHEIRRLTNRLHVSMQPFFGDDRVLKMINRVCEPTWWRKALKRRYQIVELAAIHAGYVHAAGCKYISDQSLRRVVLNQERCSRLLESMEAVNQSTGEALNLSDIVASSLANPSHRQKAMLVQVKGLEQFSLAAGKAAVFITVTAPSRFHARSPSGVLNPNFDGSSPRECQNYLNRVWRCASRKLRHSGVEIAGIRVAEPHHDGCPHMHALVFMRSDCVNTFVEILSKYALEDSSDEPGAADHRFKVVHIDPDQGSAVGYIAKYISKNLGGLCTDDADSIDSASRVVAWAKQWRIRQFQFFGTPPITPVRELHRLKNIDAVRPGLTAAHAAIQANEYSDYLDAHQMYGLAFKSVRESRPSSRYRGEQVHRLIGVSETELEFETPEILTTRVDDWVIEYRRRDAGIRPFALLGHDSITAHSQPIMPRGVVKEKPHVATQFQYGRQLRPSNLEHRPMRH